jgi:hypothetical protein
MTEHQQTQQPKTKDNTSQKQTIPPKHIPTSHPAAIIQRARINPKSLTYADVMQLQRTIGNRAVGKLLTEIRLIPLKATQAPPVQMQKIPEEEEEPLQTKKENKTGMPDNFKTGVEDLSGIDMSDVRVHYNSSKPAEVGALAYTQGTDIHVAPNHERYLSHEAWHFVQQAQGRVKPTMQLKGVAVNDNEGLEREADEMGKMTVKRKTMNVNMANKYIFEHSSIIQLYNEKQMSSTLNAQGNLRHYMVVRDQNYNYQLPIRHLVNPYHFKNPAYAEPTYQRALLPEPFGGKSKIGENPPFF